MLEGDEKSNWFLWGFSNKKASFYECHDTRSGDVASEFLSKSKCEYLVTDVYSGYGKAVREANILRQGLAPIRNVYCNAHARRKFKSAKDSFPDDAQFFIDQYKEIYKREEVLKGKPPDEAKSLRLEMVPYFEAMRERALAMLINYPAKSSMAKAINYFLNNYEALTLFTTEPELPIDNNPQERLLRNPVIGRKTWYGTHSKRGALTAAILFSVVESCRLNKVNPREYFAELIKDLHAGQAPYTPHEYKNRLCTQ
jgi:transposase